MGCTRAVATRSGRSACRTTVSRPAVGLASRTVRPFSVLQGDRTQSAKTVGVMPIATEMAGVNMRLEVGAVRSVLRSHDGVHTG